MNLTRTSGVQLHLTSLPDGRLGPSAYEWVDWLAAAGQTWWQMLPLGPPDRHRSPYKARSAFAAWKGFLASPEATVTSEEIGDFVDRHSYWAGGLRPSEVADQVRFSREWSALRAHAASRGVRLIGDVPIYVAPGSSDHRTWPDLFRSGEVAGVPPDAFSDAGQLWGNPLYDWPAMRRRGYRWWIERFRRTFELFDMTRVDHFRGFVAYWAVPEGARTAAAGRWRRGPGAAVFEAARRELGTLPVIAEDLGDITPPVTRLRRTLGFPGMAVMQFAFEGQAQSVHEPPNHPEDSVVYLGTHDNDTAEGWWSALPDWRRELVRSELRTAGIEDEGSTAWSLIRLTFASRASVAMIQAQDVLGLGSEARMNTPGRASGNWSWKLGHGDLTAELAERLREATAASGRLPQ